MSILFKKSKIIVVLGPTASGKSSLAVEIARKFGGEIISADSRQVYKGLDLGSGKITKKEMCGVPHYLLNVANPKKTFTVTQYQKLGVKAIEKIYKKGKVPIICGGTGLYIDALIYNNNFPEVPPQPKLRKQFEKLTTEKLFEKLEKLDSHRAKNIDKYNRRRLIRALEIVITTGKPVPPLVSIISHNNPHESAFVIIGIKKSPDELRKIIKKRLLKRLKIGMIGEVKNLHAQGLSWKRLDDFGLEYRFISRYLRQIEKIKNGGGSIRINSRPNPYKSALEEMENLIINESLAYAKRQMTWFKRNKSIIWISKKSEAIKLTKNFLK